MPREIPRTSDDDRCRLKRDARSTPYSEHSLAARSRSSVTHGAEPAGRFNLYTLRRCPGDLNRYHALFNPG